MSNTPKKPVIFLMGPTATGKTDCAIKLADEFGFEIINTDSALVYKGMDIGTAKPTEAEQKGIPHHLIDIRKPDQPYSAGSFCENSLKLIPEIHNRGKIPCFVGGTMLYFHYLENDQLGQPESDPEIRAAIEAQATEKGWPAMWELLHQLNPERANQLHPNDRQRIARSIEIERLNKKEKSTDDKKAFTEQYNLLHIALHSPNRALLHQRIELRFQKMLESGFLDEARNIFDEYKEQLSLPSMRIVGYRQAFDFFLGERGKEEFSEKAVVATRQLAKRQHTWLNKWPDAHKIDAFSDDPAQSMREQIIKHLNDTPA